MIVQNKNRHKIQNYHCTADGSVVNLKLKMCAFPPIVMVEQLGRVPLGLSTQNIIYSHMKSGS